MVKIKYIGYLAELAGKREEEIKLDKPTKIRELIDLQRVKLEELIILVNGLPGSLDSVVSGEDEISVLPVISGG